MGTTGTLPSGHPYMRVGSGPHSVVYVGGLEFNAGLPQEGELRRVSAVFERHGDRVTTWVLWRRPHTGPTSIAEMAAGYAEAIRSELPALGAPGGPVGVFGISTGGAIAQHLAADHPDTVSRLVLSLCADRFDETGLRFQKEFEGLIRAGRWRSAYARIGPKFVPKHRRIARYLFWLMGPRIMPPPKDPTHMLAELEAEDDHDLGARLATIAAPTLVQLAELDEFYAPERTRALAAAIPGARLVTYPGFVHMEPWPALTDDAYAFLTEE
jgi:pimeloyl-ACP methyl ester carboxylesterase